MKHESDELKVYAKNDFTKCKHQWFYVWDDAIAVCQKCGIPEIQFKNYEKAIQEARKSEEEKGRSKLGKMQKALENANECIKIGLHFGWKTIEWDKCITFNEQALQED